MNGLIFLLQKACASQSRKVLGAYGAKDLASFLKNTTQLVILNLVSGLTVNVQREVAGFTVNVQSGEASRNRLWPM